MVKDIFVPLYKFYLNAMKNPSVYIHYWGRFSRLSVYFFLFILLHFSAYSQEITFEKFQEEIGINLKEDVKVKIKVKYDSKNDIQITVEDTKNGDAEPGKDYDLSYTPPFKHTFLTTGSSREIELQLVVKKEATENKTIILRLIAGQTGGGPVIIGKDIMLIRIVNDVDNFNKPKNNYVISLGSNFDFLSKLELDKLYADAYAFMPHLFSVKTSKKFKPKDINDFLKKNTTTNVDSLKKAAQAFFKTTEKRGAIRVGLDVGMYRNKLISLPGIDLKNDTILRSPSKLQDIGTKKDSVRYRQERFVDNTTLTVDNLGLYLSPTILLNPNGENNTQLYFFLHGEVIQRTFTQTTEITVVNAIERQTSLVEFNKLANQVYRVGTAGAFRRTYYDSYFGGGLLVHHRSKLAEVKLKSGVTWASLGSQTVYKRDSNGNIEKNTGGGPQIIKWPVMFFVNFMMKEAKSGVKLGGEVRGAVNTYNNPNIYVYIAKEFSIEKIIELFN